MAADEHHAGVGAPGAAQIDGAGAAHPALVEDEPSLGVVVPLLRRDGAAALVSDGADVAVLVERLAVAEDPVDGAADVARPEVVAAFLVVQRVLSSEERAPIERALVTLDSQRHCLPPDCATTRGRCRVLKRKIQVE